MNEEKQKPGPKAKKTPEMERIENMERCLSKMAHMTGQQRVLDEFGISRWELQPVDMAKYRG